MEPNSIAVKPEKRGLLSSSRTLVQMVIQSTSSERFIANKPRMEYGKHL